MLRAAFGMQEHVCSSDLNFQEDYLSTGKFSSMCQRPLSNSWFTHKRLDLEETELYTGQGECLSVCF